MNKGSPVLAASRTEVEDPVRAFQDVEVVLDDHDGVPLLEQGVEGFKEFGHVVDVQSGRRFVKNEEGVTLSVPPGEEGGELDALCFSARQGGAGLSKGDVPKPHIHQHIEDPFDLPVTGKEVSRTGDAHPEHICDGAPPVSNVEGLRVEAGPSTDLTRDLHIAQELHLHGDHSGSPAVMHDRL